MIPVESSCESSQKANDVEFPAAQLLPGEKSPAAKALANILIVSEIDLNISFRRVIYAFLLSIIGQTSIAKKPLRVDEKINSP